MMKFGGLSAFPRRRRELADVDLLDVRDTEQLRSVKSRDDELVGRTLRSARKSVLGSTVAGSIPRYLSTAGVAT